MAGKAEDDLFKLAAQGGSEEARAKAGLSIGPVFLEPESDGRRPAINQDGDDPGFETRVKSPTRRTGIRASSGSKGDSDAKPEKKAVGRPRGTASDRSIDEVSSAIEEKFAEYFGYIALALPVTGTYGAENSDKAVKALISIGKRRPAVMKALMKIADGADGMDIIKFGVGLVVAAQVDMQRLAPDAFIARTVGVTAVIEKYFIEDEPSANPNVTGQQTNAAPRFQPVS